MCFSVQQTVVLLYSLHIHCYSSASAFLSPLHCWNRAAPTATFYCCAGRSRARCSGITALQSRATAPHCCNSYCTSAHLCKTRPPSSQKCNTKLSSLNSINANDQLQLHCDLCTVPVSQLVGNAPPQSLQSTSSIWLNCDCFNDR